MNVYGIKTCDSCRKARRWLDERGQTYRWHDFRADGVDGDAIRTWLDALGPEGLVNRRSTTWRGLNESERAAAMNAATAAGFLVEHPTLIKRPVFEVGDRVFVGFDAAVREAL